MKLIIEITDNQATAWIGTCTHEELRTNVEECLDSEGLDCTVTLEDPSLADTTVLDPEEIEDVADEYGPDGEKASPAPAWEASEPNDGEG